MEVGHWITLGAVIVALGLGVASILQTQMMKNRERRERLLNEIIEWAIEAANIGFEESIISPPDAGADGVDEYDMQRMILSKLSSVYSKCQIIDSRYVYIYSICRKLSKKLHKYVSDVSFRIDNLERYLEINIKESTGLSIPKGDELTKLKKSAQNLIAEATKIKTSDIS